MTKKTEKEILQLIESIAIDVGQHAEGKLDQRTLIVFMHNIAKQAQELRLSLVDENTRSEK